MNLVNVPVMKWSIIPNFPFGFVGSNPSGNVIYYQ